MISSANGSAAVVLMDGEHGRLVAALFNGDERNDWGARVRKGWSNDLPDIKRTTSLPLVTPFDRWLGTCVRRFQLEFGRSTRWGRLTTRKGRWVVEDHTILRQASVLLLD